MRHVRMAVWVAVLIMAALPAGASTTYPCGKRGFRVVQTTKQVVLAVRGSRREDAEWIACLRPRGRAVDLSDVDAYQRKHLIRGTWVVFYRRGIDDGSAAQGYSEVDAVNVARPSPLPERRVGDPYSRGDGTVANLVLRTDGAVGLIGCPFDQRPSRSTTSDPLYCVPRRDRPVYEVMTSSSRMFHVAEGVARRRSAVVDSGREIDPDSLRLTKDGVSWIHSGRRRHAKFAGE